MTDNIQDNIQDNIHQTHDRLQSKYNKLVIQHKKQKRYNRKSNRKTYHLAREEAAKSEIIKDLHNKYNVRINNLNTQIRDQTSEIDNLQEECTYWIHARGFMRQKYFASLAFGIISSFAYIITLKGIENCICE
jgi:hypothetical protein